MGELQNPWIDHAGTGMPVGRRTRVNVRFRDGKVWEDRFAGDMNREDEDFWTHEPTSPEDDIVAYQVPA